MSEISPDPSALVIPFGKHKGATVAELLATDPDYVRWVTAQGWFAERFAELHSAVITRGAAAPDDTPEHNALQARFMDPKFRHACLRLLMPDRLDSMREYAAKNGREWADRKSVDAKERRDYFADLLAADEKYQAEHDGKWPWHGDRNDQWRCRTQKASLAEAKQRLIELDEAISQAVLDRQLAETAAYHLFSSVRFEVGGVDVTITWQWSRERPRTDIMPDGHSVGVIGIELKPTFGDDYPTIMRQMQRLRCHTLVAGSYNGRGVSEPVLKAMFAANGYTLVFVREIEAKVA